MKKLVNKKTLKRFVPVAVATLFLAITVGFTACQQSGTSQSNQKSQEQITGLQHYDGYTMEQMTVLSRHNIRSPLTDAGSSLGKLTPHQ